MRYSRTLEGEMERFLKNPVGWGWPVLAIIVLVIVAAYTETLIVVAAVTAALIVLVT